MRHNAFQKSPWSKRKLRFTVLMLRFMRGCYFVWHTLVELLRRRKFTKDSRLSKSAFTTLHRNCYSVIASASRASLLLHVSAGNCAHFCTNAWFSYRSISIIVIECLFVCLFVSLSQKIYANYGTRSKKVNVLRAYYTYGYGRTTTMATGVLRLRLRAY